MTDSLTFKQNSDGSYEVSWDKDDPDWNFMNDLTSKEIAEMVQIAIRDHQKNLGANNQIGTIERP
jgi:hypothetical protein